MFSLQEMLISSLIVLYVLHSSVSGRNLLLHFSFQSLKVFLLGQLRVDKEEPTKESISVAL